MIAPCGSVASRARNLRLALEELGPSFAKLGQILSTRPDMLPPEVVDELSRLQDDVKPLSEAEVVSVMEAELGVPWEDVFETIDPQPLAAGTIGQVHRATLETGERVVVKVQRPSARDDILRDLRLLELFAEKVASLVTLDRVADIPTVVEHLSESLRRELDFREEAASIDRLRDGLEPFRRLGAPAVYHQLSSERLLVMEEIQGVPLREAPPGAESKEAAGQLLESYYRQILQDGFFHADPHPGNLLWWNGRIYFIDFGMVGEVDPRVRELVLLLLLAFWREDASFLAEIVVSLSDTTAPPDLDIAALERDLDQLIGQFRHASLRELEIGPLLQAIVTTCSRHGLRMPAALALTGKALAQVQLAVAELDPELDPLAPLAPLMVRMLAGRALDRRPEAALLRGAEARHPRAQAGRSAPSAGHSRSGWSRTSSDRGQAELAEQGDRVRVDVLARDEAVADRDHVHALVVDLAAGRRDLDAGPRHRPLVCATRRPLLDDEVLADVGAARLEREVREDREDARDRPADLFRPDVGVAGDVVLEDRVLRVHGDDRLDVVVVPGRVVAVDERLQLLPVHAV